MNVTGNGVFVDVNCEAFRVHRERFLPEGSTCTPKWSAYRRGPRLRFSNGYRPQCHTRWALQRFWGQNLAENLVSHVFHWVFMQIFGIIPFNCRWLCTLSRCTWRNDKCGFKLNLKNGVHWNLRKFVRCLNFDVYVLSLRCSMFPTRQPVKVIGLV